MSQSQLATVLRQHIADLPTREQRGSRARCLLVTHGDRDRAAGQLARLAAPHAAVCSTDGWAPGGFEDPGEVQLHLSDRFLTPAQRELLADWWLKVRPGARTPTFDLVSQAAMDGRRGILLFEAKAHQAELEGEEGAKHLQASASANSRDNHQRIGDCISEACASLGACSGLPWAISRDTHYQMSNRFAWAWKLASVGIPVVLVYLGFLQANEMGDCGKPIANAEAWEALVHQHADPIVPASVWGRRLAVGSASLTPLIRSLSMPLP